MQVWHMSGAGNDFMVLDVRGVTVDLSQTAKSLCAPTGADGLMAVDVSDCADFRLHFYNSDGSRGEMCGNGSRCLCRFAYDNGIAGEEMTVKTDAGLIYGWHLAENRYRVKLNNPSILEENRLPDVAYVELGSPGIPHGVARIPNLCWEEKSQYWDKAVALRHHKAFPKGINVNFYDWIGDSSVRVLTYERFVEDYTLACGTGCASIAATLFSQGKLPQKKLTCHNQGGILEVTLEETDGTITDLYLEGPVEVLKIYQLDI